MAFIPFFIANKGLSIIGTNVSLYFELPAYSFELSAKDLSLKAIGAGRIEMRLIFVNVENVFVEAKW